MCAAKRCARDHAHKQGVIHRDIKPENILLQDGAAVVADFGIALAVQQAGGQRMTQTGLSLGTPQYMSPEQAMGERTIDARSDIYALGAVTYEMLTGEPPFTGASVQAIVARVLTEKPTSITTFRDMVSPPVERAVLSALAKLPADRPPTAALFANALAPSETSASAVPSALEGGGADAQPHRKRRAGRGSRSSPMRVAWRPAPRSHQTASRSPMRAMHAARWISTCSAAQRRRMGDGVRR